MRGFLFSFTLALSLFQPSAPSQCLPSKSIHNPSSLTTWDEPWQKEIIEDSDTFVRVKVTLATPERVEFNVLKQIAGEEIPDTGTLVGFSKLEFGSYSVREDVFNLRKGAMYYLFLENTEEENEYHIATPTSGFAITSDGRTTATYRHSLHQAYAPDEVYEMTMIAIFSTLKGQETDLAEVEKYIATQLEHEPTGTEEFKRFCSQHIALELLYYLGGGELRKLEPFLKHDDSHVQASAVRALGKLQRDISQKRLIDFIADPTRSPLAKVMAIWALRDLEAKEAADDLSQILKSTEDQDSSMGVNLMDPRIGTQFPKSVHFGIRSLLETWERE